MPATETLATSQRYFRLKYSDGTVERYTGLWVAQVEHETWESGGPAKPFEGKFIDDRQCHWWVKGRIIRQAGQITKFGATSWFPELAKPYTSDFVNKGSDFALAASGLGTEDCGECADRRNSDFQNMRNSVTAAFDAVVGADLQRLREELKSASQATEVDLEA